MTAIWRNLPHRELTTKQLYDILKLRSTVFVMEQECLYQDIDDQDLIADNHHIICYEGDELIAYARVLTNDQPDNTLSIGRVIVAPSARGAHLGYTLMKKAIESCTQYNPNANIHISAQAHLQKFYGHLGFIPSSDIYEEDGIPHIAMTLHPKS